MCLRRLLAVSGFNCPMCKPRTTPLSPSGAVTCRKAVATRPSSRLTPKKELLAENAMLRQLADVLRTNERVILVALASMFTRWRDALVLIDPETVLRWHRQGFRLLWTWRSKSKSRPKSRLPAAVVELIRLMAIDNRLWGTFALAEPVRRAGHRDD
jgi:hypothetical protein